MDERTDLPGGAPQPPEEEAPGGQAPRVGVDEWVATAESRTLRRTGFSALPARALTVLPPLGWLAVVVAATALFPLLTDSDYLVRVGVNTLLFALLALGLNVVVGWAGLLDLGYVAFYGFGAYTYAILSSSQFDIHLPTAVTLVVVLAASALLGFLLAQPSRRLLGDYLAIVTLFFAQIFLVIVTNATRWTGGPNGIAGLDDFSFLGWEADTVRDYFYISLAMFAVVAAALWLLDTSRTGRAWKAVREDPLAAAAMGMPVNRLKILAFMFGAAIAGLSGAVFGAVQTGVFPQNFELPLLITIYAMVILGGAGSLPGVVLGAALITILLEVLRNPEDARLVFYVVIVAGVAALVRPWTRVVAVLATTVVLGLVVHAVAARVWERGVEGTPAEGSGRLGRLVDGWVLLPSDPKTIGNVAFVALVVAVLGLTLLKPRLRLFALPPVLYLSAFVWETRLVLEPSITRLLLLGALLVALMTARPQGLLGTPRVEIV